MSKNERVDSERGESGIRKCLFVIKIQENDKEKQ